MSEQGHWYDRDGRLILSVPYKDPKRRDELKPTTLREAREMLLHPSVTTVNGILDKPGVRKYYEKRIIKAALLFGPAGMFDNEKDHEERILEAAREHAERAAQLGTQVHLGISMGLTGPSLAGYITSGNIEQEMVPVIEGALSWLESSMCELKVTASERTFVSSKYGFAGTMDIEGLYRDKPCIADFKTQDFDRVQDAEFYDPEYPLQLAGYDLGTRRPGEFPKQRLSIVISRSTPGLIATKLWPDAERWDAAFLALWEFWKRVKNYEPPTGAHLD